MKKKKDRKGQAKLSRRKTKKGRRKSHRRLSIPYRVNILKNIVSEIEETRSLKEDFEEDKEN